MRSILISRLNGNLPKNNTSGKAGVSKHRKLWLATITFRQKAYRLGSYVSFEEAVKIREQAEGLLFAGFLKWYDIQSNNTAEFQQSLPEGEGRIANAAFAQLSVFFGYHKFRKW